MHITLSPRRQDAPLKLAVNGDTLTLNGQKLDLSAIPDGATLPLGAIACDWIASDIERISGVLHLTLVLPHGPNAPEQTLFPKPISVTKPGPVPLPPFTTEHAE